MSGSLYTQEEVTAAYRKAAEDAAIRPMIVDLLNFCALFVSGAEDTNQLWRREGQRDVAQHLIRRLERADPTAYPRILMDHAEKVTEHEGGKQ